MRDLSPFRKIALQASEKAGRILRRGLQGKIEISYKGDLNLVTNIDTGSEKAIVALIGRHFPNHQIIAEEGHGQKEPSPFRWIIDPLDGTTNYAHAFPFFCVSIALEIRGKVALGVVYDPIRKECFFAEKGKGAFLNGKPISVSSVKKLSKSLLVTGFAYDIRTDPSNNFNHFINVSMNAQAVRRTGSAALDLCYVAAGRLDGFWELKLKPWDTAAGSLILREAGGKITDFSGKPYSIYDSEILATNQKIHQEMRQILNKNR
ncbi:MAG TPA: inositol monophosphatase family protein [Candidatus Manganitrophaceae bacterium]|nr:inositol monophosphatase family protein [Candidatus Manganitrophaceae bacterium]